MPRPAAAAAVPPQPTAPAADSRPGPAPWPVASAPPLTARWWPWPLVSALFHGLVIVSAVLLGGFAFGPAEEPPLMVIGSMDLIGLGRDGPAGGDGLDSGRGGAAPGEAVASEAKTLAPPEPEATAPSPAPVSPEQARATAPEPPPAPEPVPVPSLETATPPPPKPAPALKARPRQAPEVPRIRQAGPKPAAPVSPPQTATTAAATGVGSGEGTGDGPGRGLVGEGTGQGLAQGAGPGGDGSGSGGSGLAEERFGQGDGPKFRHRCLPRYPDAAKRSGQEGRVRLKLTIDAEGLLRNVAVIEHTGLEFVEEALRAVQGSTFLPAVHQGRPVACHALLTIHFKLG